MIETFIKSMASGITFKKKGGTPEGARQGNPMLTMAENPQQSNDSGVVTFFNNGLFKKKLRWKIENPPNHSERWHITPEMAETMLEWNDRNRPVTPGKVKDYAEAMLHGRWHYTGEPIVFSRERILDGQHRLLACITAGTAFDALVTFGVPDDSFAYIDIGKKRSTGDIFAINGVKNHLIMAAAITWVVGYDANTLGAAARSVKLDHAQLYEQYEKHSGLQDSAWVAQLFGPAKLASPSMMCAFHYICSRKSRAEADAFFRRVAEGLGFTGKRDPAYRLHKYLVDAAIANQRPGRSVAAALTIKAWNASRRGRDVGVLRFDADEAFPRII